MSDEINEQIENTLNSNLNSDYDIHIGSSNMLNIAVIGKTKAGKSSFINAFRGITNDHPDAAKTGIGVNPTNVAANNQKFVIKDDDDSFQINLFDIKGFSDNNDTEVEPQLDEIKKACNIKEFDAIIFLTVGGLEKKELDLAKFYESKMVMLFFVYNQIDMFCRNYLTSKNLYDRKKSEYDLFMQHQGQLVKEIKKNKNELYENLSDRSVFNSQICEVTEFICKDLKSERYKSAIITNSIYLITSDQESFEDKFLSPDGPRIRAEIKIHLRAIKMENLNLFDPYCKRTIFLKKKILLSEMFKTIDSKRKLALGAALSIIPILDIPYTNSTRNSFKNKFFELFGIKELEDFLTGKKVIAFRLTDDQKNKLEKLMIKIKKDKVIDTIDVLVENADGINSQNLIERATQLVNVILPSIGVALASLTDDIASKIASLAIGLGKALSKGLLIFLAVVTIPIGMAIYVFLAMKAIERILIRYEEYSLIIAEILHPTANLQINPVKY
jgi:GTPase SAR1 family protein